MATPLVSFLVAAWEENPNIEPFIESYLSLSYNAKELILCAGGSDGTFDQATKLANNGIHILEQHAGEGKQSALRRCYAISQGEIIFLTDADCILNDASVRRMLDVLVEKGEEVVSGAFIPLSNQLDEPFVLYQLAVENTIAAHSPIYVVGLQGRNSALTRRALDQVGGFAKQVATGTDYYLAMNLLRADYRIYFEKDSYVETCYPEDFRTFLRKQSRWARNLLVHGPHFGAWGDVRAVLRTVIIGILMLIWPLSFPWTGYWGIFLWIAALAYGLLVRVQYLANAERTFHHRFGPSVYLRLPLYMFVDFLAWAGIALDYLLPQRRTRW